MKAMKLTVPEPVQLDLRACSRCGLGVSRNGSILQPYTFFDYCRDAIGQAPESGKGKKARQTLADLVEALDAAEEAKAAEVVLSPESHRLLLSVTDGAQFRPDIVAKLVRFDRAVDHPEEISVEPAAK